MKFLDFVKDDKFLSFAGGVAAATAGVKILKSEKTRNLCVNGLAKCMKLSKDAQETLRNMKEDAEDICCDARKQAEAEEEEK